MTTDLFDQVPAGWSPRTLESVCTKVTSGGTPSRQSPAFYVNGVWPWVKTQELVDAWVDETEELITEDAVRGSSAKVLPTNTLLLAMYGATVGQLGILKRPMTCNQACCALLVDEQEANFRFVYYLLLSARARIRAQSTGAAQQNLSGTQIKQFRFAFPEPSVQRAMARVLGTLDDKIELNRRMSQTMEAIAQAIFRSWFVDFDPVVALSDGQDPMQVANRFGLPSEVVSLFATEFVEADGQVTPAGWKLSTLGQEVKTHGGLLQTGPFGSQLHASDYTDEGVPVVMPQDLVNRRIATGRIARIPQDTADGLKRHMLKAGDVVYSRRGDVERHALVSPREVGWLCGTGCLLVRMGSGWPSQAYLSETLNDKTTREWIVRHAVGATMPNLNTSILASVPLLIPPAPLLQHFESVVGTLREQQEALSSEAESLAAVRDELLPRLLSGELVVA